jgi:hypothetical protein
LHPLAHPRTASLEVSYDCTGCSGYSAATPEAIADKYFMEYCLFVTLMPVFQLQHRNLLPEAKLWRCVKMYRLFSCNTLTTYAIK